MLLKNWGFTSIAVLTLALGIGANTAIFSVINAVLLRPLPFYQPEQLVTVWNVNLKEGNEGFSVSYPDFNDWRSQQQSFEKLAAFRQRDITLTGLGEAVRLRGASLTSDLLPLLGVAPQLGRVFIPDEDRAGHHAVILSHSLWLGRFKSDPNIVGRTITINGESYTIVGVMPAGFTFPISSDPVELWIGAAIDNEGGNSALTAQRGNHTIEVIGRLKAGVTLAQAQTEMTRITQILEKQYADNPGIGALVVPFFDRVIGDLRTPLLLLLAAVACVLLIACANVANLLLARAASRQKEMAVRAALGANRWRVIRQLLTESVLLSLAGGLAGLLIAAWGTELLLSMAPAGLPRITETTIDGRVLVFALLVSVLTGIFFGLTPALHSSRFDLVTLLKESGRGVGVSAQGNRIRHSLIVAQVALAFVLLICAGLLIGSFRRLQQVNPGFDPNNVLTFRISLPVNKYTENEQVESFYRQLVSRIRALPGVASASATHVLPLSGGNSAVGFAIEGVPTEPDIQFPYETAFRATHPGYFATMGIRLLQGRDFDERDTMRGSQVTIINETLARKHFPNQNPLGRRINPSFGIDERGVQWREIIGVVEDVQHSSLSKNAGPECYVPHAQAPWHTLTIVARTKNDAKALITAVRKEVDALDGDLPLFSIRTLDEYLALSVAQQRFSSLLLSIFACVALILTAIGLYGVMAYSVTQRTHEIGIRMALGAQTGVILRLVIRQGMALALIGVLIGLGAALALTRLIKSLLFNTSATDPLIFISISVLLVIVGFLACFIPASRAARVDPINALRNE
jgi:putative ABC transport system permease protein